DREPDPAEVAACAPWLDAELTLLRPKLVLPIGRMAIAALLGERPLVETVGQLFRTERAGVPFDAIPLPHPSGASTWFRGEPGKTLLKKARGEIEAHPAWQGLRGTHAISQRAG